MKVSKLRFTNPVLHTFKFDINESFILSYQDRPSRVIKKPTFTTSISYKDINSETAFVLLTINIGNKTAEMPFECVIKIGAEFSWDSTSTQEEIDTFKSISAPAHLMSYARPIIAMITSMSPFPTYQLPFINFTEH